MKYVPNIPERRILHCSNHLVEEYRKLVVIPSPSDDELNQIDHILELAIYDDELNDLINEIDQELEDSVIPASTISKLEVTDISNALGEAQRDFSSQNNNFVMHYNASQTSQDAHLLSKKKLLGDSQAFISSRKKFLVGGLLLLMIELVSSCYQITFPNAMVPVNDRIGNSIRQSNKGANNLTHQGIALFSLINDSNEKLVRSYNNSNETFLFTNKHHDNKHNANETNQEFKNKFTNPELQKTYDSLNLLKIRISDILQPSQRIGLSRKAEQIQSKAESKQIEAQSKQMEAESKQIKAELKNYNDLALHWRTQAQRYLKESEQWLNLAQNSVDIVKQL
ncbi:hypothetical protein [Nostoc sp.]|uniref:hypothetical protein n=1 Tax=Nostoc sp. TaxID=1180 RepID=UPI002FF5F977